MIGIDGVIDALFEEAALRMELAEDPHDKQVDKVLDKIEVWRELKAADGPAHAFDDDFGGV